MKKLLQEVKQLILTSRELTDREKVEFMKIITDIERGKLRIKLKKYGKLYLLHELAHIYLKHHLTFNRKRNCKHCVIENLVLDIKANEFIQEKFGLDMKHLLKENYELLLSSYGTIPNLVNITCSRCRNIQVQGDVSYVSTVEFTDYENLLYEEIKRRLQKFEKRRYIAKQHRNYIGKKYFVVTKQLNKEKIPIYVDTSTSIERPIVESSVKVAKQFETICDIYGFSSIVYKLNGDIIYEDKTNIESVIDMKPGIIITDKEFDVDIPNTFEVIDICSLLKQLQQS